jgi:nifR3 family TIM-barrel protein
VTTATTAKPLMIGHYVLGMPVVLAPMAGITNQAFRRVCREFGPGGVYVSEMVTSRALVERTPESMRLITHDADERPRSVQLYGVDPHTVGAAVRMLVDEDQADHVDLNFGCPVAKVTRKGGGAALPWKTTLFAAIVREAVRAAVPAGVPVTVKMRKGVDDGHLTYLDAGRAAQDEGASAVALHARTAADYYGGVADWEAIARLREVVTEVPLLGNGDIWSAQDALVMMARTGCDGVVVGRGCLGRPWLFADLAAAFAGRAERATPTLREATATLRHHAALLCEHYGDPGRGMRDMRKHMAWYLKGYAVGQQARAAFGLVSGLDELDERIASLDLDQPYPGAPAEGPRGRTVGAKRVALPDGWLADRETSLDVLDVVREAELSVSGG